jgi:hypothetical protein
MPSFTVCQITDRQLRNIVLLARSKTSLAWEWDTVELNAFIKMNAARPGSTNAFCRREKLLIFQSDVVRQS